MDFDSAVLLPEDWIDRMVRVSGMWKVYNRRNRTDLLTEYVEMWEHSEDVA